MVSLGAVKQTLHDNSPWLYEKVHRFYQMTPYAKQRNARLTRIQDDLSKKVQARFEYELQIVGEYLNDDWTVRHGPFSGMKFAPVPPPNSFLATKVIGCYESQIHQWINDAIAFGYDRILDIGCAEGYYAVGFALKSRNTTVYAYDIDQRSRGNTAALARLNGIAEKVHVRGLCTFDEFNREVSNRTLIFCDIEGSEFDLLRPDLAPALSRADLIVEMHDFCRPGVTETLVQRFLPSHRIEIVYHCAKYAAEFPVLKAISAGEHSLLLEEGRPRNQCWMRLLANQPGAIEPVIEWWPAGEVPVKSPLWSADRSSCSQRMAATPWPSCKANTSSAQAPSWLLTPLPAPTASSGIPVPTGYTDFIGASSLGGVSPMRRDAPVDLHVKSPDRRQILGAALDVDHIASMQA